MSKIRALQLKSKKNFLSLFFTHYKLALSELIINFVS